MIKSRKTCQIASNSVGVETSVCGALATVVLWVAASMSFVVCGCGQASSNSESSAVDVEEVVVASNSKNVSAAKRPVAAARPTTQDNESHPDTLSQPPREEPSHPSLDTSSVGYRLPKVRIAPADSVLAKYGLRKIESKRLLLLTDSNDPELDELPILADQLFHALQDWFGELPPAADDSDFQVLGHLMIDRGKFRAAGLLPDESFSIRHGRHLRYAFWAGYPDTAYYRRHLALHEFVHCYMTCESDALGVPPPWYLEGMAELFGTHSVVVDGANDEVIGLTEAGFKKASPGSGIKATFAVMPAAAEGFEGWGRIRAFRETFAAADHQQLVELQVPTFNEVVPKFVAVFESPFQYSSSWAVCWFLKHHPDAVDVMPALAKQSTYSGFVAEWERQRNEFGNRLAVDWLLFSEQLDFGFDPDRCFPVHGSFESSSSDLPSSSKSVRLLAQQGWQDTGVVVRSGFTVELQCEGHCVVNETTEPWESSPDGISIEYYRGHRLGQVVAVLVSANGKQITDRIPIGSAAQYTAGFDGRIWLQVNDASNARSNNRGNYQVQLEWSP